MIRTVSIVGLATAILAGMVGPGAPGAWAAAPARPAGGGHCGTGAYSYSYSASSCSVVPVSGTFKIQVHKRHLKVKIVLRGNGTQKCAGTSILVVNVSVPGTYSTKSFTFKVTASGPMPPLHLSGKGKLYKYNPATKRWYRVKWVKGPGLYKVVYR